MSQEGGHEDGWSPGASVGRFRLERRLGAGGMGEVWAAKDTRLGRRVALKRLLPSLTRHRDGLRRFEREARTQAALKSPHVAALHGIERIERDDGDTDVVIVMELVPGRSLAALLEEGPLDVDDAVALFAQLAYALSEAHRAGVVHRDLKPSNLLVTDDGMLVVVDFGIAWQPEGDEAAEAITRTGGVVGSAGYMSPQQTTGERVGPEADIWSAGVTLYRMLAGRLPFHGANAAEMLAAVVRDEPEPLYQVRPDVPRAVSDLVEACLRKDPDERPRDGAELFDLLPPFALSALDSRGALLDPAILAKGTVRSPLSGPLRTGLLVLALLAIPMAWWSASARWADDAPMIDPDRGEEIAAELLRALELTDLDVHRARGYEAGDEGTELWVRFRREPLHVERRTPTAEHPPHLPGELIVWLDPDGRLRRLEHWPGQAPPRADLAPLLRAAGLRGEAEAPGRRIGWNRGAPVFARQTADGEVKVATLGGVLLSFSRADAGPMTQHEIGIPQHTGRRGGLVLFALFVIGGLLRWRDGRGDVRGAFTFGFLVILLGVLRVLAMPLAIWYGGWRDELQFTSGAAIWGGLVYYIFEPTIRRWWPSMLAGWERLIRYGRVDHMVGREILVGAAAPFGFHAAMVVEHALGVDYAIPREIVAVAVSSPSTYVYALLARPAVGVMLGLSALFVAALVRRAVPSARIALLVCAVGAGVFTAQVTVSPGYLMMAVAGLLYLFVMLRGGVVAMMVSVTLTSTLWLVLPPRLGDWTLPYSLASSALALGVVAVGAWGLRRSPRIRTRSGSERSADPPSRSEALPVDAAHAEGADPGEVTGTRPTKAARPAKKKAAPADALTETLSEPED